MNCGRLRRCVLPFIVALVVVLLMFAAGAWADLPTRAATWSWDRADVLRGTFSYRDALEDKEIAKKLKNGLAVNLVMRGYVYPNDGGDPIALTAHTCKIAYQLWDDYYEVVVNGTRKPPVVVVKGVYRLCTDLVEIPVVERKLLKAKATNYFLAVKVELNPVSDEMLKKIQKWVTRPSGASGGISPGDALFASFVGVFMKKVATADRVVEFKTAAFPP